MVVGVAPVPERCRRGFTESVLRPPRSHQNRRTKRELWGGGGLDVRKTLLVRYQLLLNIQLPVSIM